MYLYKREVNERDDDEDEEKTTSTFVSPSSPFTYPYRWIISLDRLYKASTTIFFSCSPRDFLSICSQGTTDISNVLQEKKKQHAYRSRASFAFFLLRRLTQPICLTTGNVRREKHICRARSREMK